MRKYSSKTKADKFFESLSDGEPFTWSHTTILWREVEKAALRCGIKVKYADDNQHVAYRVSKHESKLTNKQVTTLRLASLDHIVRRNNGDPIWLVSVIEVRLTSRDEDTAPRVLIKARARRYRNGKIRKNANEEWESQIDLYIEDLVKGAVKENCDAVFQKAVDEHYVNEKKLLWNRS